MNRYFEEDPGTLVETAFRKIEEGSMRGLPVCHAGLTTEWVGGVRWHEYWVGCLVTPWTLQLLMLPATSTAEILPDGAARIWEFPQCPLTFRAIENPELGVYQSCGLCSPVTGYASQTAIRQVSREVMDLLLQPTSSQGIRHQPQPVGPGRMACEPPTKELSTRRDFLRAVWY